MKIVYIAHPISGAVKQNLAQILQIVREINLTMPNVVPLVPYYADCLALDDNNKDERARGIKNGLALIKQRRVDEVWCYGNFISAGMQGEIDAAKNANIPIVIKGDLRAYLGIDK